MIRAADAHAAIEAFPVTELREITGGAPVLVLAPHPDDESLGCGGLIAESVASGLPVSVLMMTDGAGSHPGSREWPAARLAALRASEARDAVAILGLPASDIAFLGLPDTAAPREGAAFEHAVGAILDRALGAGEGRDAVMAAPWIGDPHGDHEAVQLMARAAARRAGLRLLSYPVWGWTLGADAMVAETAPLAGFRLDVSAHRARKRAAIAAHRSQYGGLITDDPSGFRLPASLLDACDRNWEAFVETPA